MPKLNLHNALIAAAIVLLTLKFRNELLGFTAKIPVIGDLLA